MLFKYPKIVLTFLLFGILFIGAGCSECRSTSDCDGAKMCVNGDCIETVNGFEIGNGDGDTDSDGLTDYDEIYSHFTDPANPDTDADQLIDGWEVDNGFSPTNAFSIAPPTRDDDADPDSDALNNLGEQTETTDPNNPDHDGDTLLDGWEVLYGFNPLLRDTDGNSTDDDQEDNEPDGLINAGEQSNGTHPFVVDSDSDGQRLG